MDEMKQVRELRKFPRYPVNLPAEAENYQQRIPVVVSDISVSGLGFKTARVLAPETYISIRIMLGRPVVFHGLVVWAFDTLTQKGQTYMAGMETDVIIDRREELISIPQRERIIEEIMLHLKSRARVGVS